AGDQMVALPGAGKHALGGAAFVARAGIELAMAWRRPGNDLDLVLGTIAHDLADALERGAAGAHHGHFEDARALRYGGRPGSAHAALPRSSPASARSIRRTTLSRPNSLMKAPMRGPCSEPSSTS